MGEVYAAHDPHLQREVAIKILRDNDPEAVKRFIREARTQARVQHENICPIYEVGEDAGKPYIVMQLITGRTLNEAAPAMTLEQKALTMVQVASAVHEAHRTGLVHRDIKPGNIMVEETDDGELKPFVMDFGIARPLISSELTVDGRFLGTPSFSSPEQVRGEGSAIDRRSDVYSLGATLYSMLSGAAPFSGPTPSVLLEVLDSTPRSLRPAGIPLDLETITMKCLEKEPERRYQSAKAIAGDLQRFVDGDPIEARPVGLARRIWLRARKHKMTATVATVGLLALALALAWGGSTRWQAKIRERLVRDLTTQVESIEAEVRYSHMAPMHDLRQDQARMRHGMSEIQKKIERAGAIATGPGHYALGRGHLALENLEEARRHLELAWNSGYQEPRVAGALAITLSSIFRDKLANIEALAEPELRHARRDQLEIQYQKPALDLLRIGANPNSAADSYAQALLEMHEHRFDDALHRLRTTQDRPSWLYETSVLEGDILRQRALELRDQGDPLGARTDLLSALEAYNASIHIAPSDPGNRLASALTRQQLMLLGEFESAEVELHYLSGLEHLEAAATINPEDARVFLLEARLHHRMAERLRHAGKDPGELYMRALHSAIRATEDPTQRSAAFMEAGIIHSGRARLFKGSGKSSEQTAAINEAIQALDKVNKEDQDYRYFTTMGVIFTSVADGQSAVGEDARQAYRQAINAYREADLRHPGSFITRYNLGVTLRKLASAPQTADRLTVLEEAVAAFDHARAINPEHPAPLYYLGLCHLGLAQSGDPFTESLGPEADTALQCHRDGLELNPKMFQFHSAIGEVLYLQALQAWEHGEDPGRLFDEADHAYQAGLEINPDYAWLHLNRAWANYYRGKYRIREGLDAKMFLDRAFEQAERAFKLAEPTGATLCLGSVWRMRAEHQFLTGRDAAGSIRRAIESFERILQANPEMPSAHRAMGRALTLEARILEDRSEDPGPAYDRARESFERALELKPRAPSFCLAEARRCLRLARWQQIQTISAQNTLVRGLEFVNRALEAKPGWAEAGAVRAALLHLETGVAENGEMQSQARDELRNALAVNPHLQFEFGSLLGEPTASE